MYAKQIGQSIFQTYHVQQRQWLRRIEIRNQIDIRRIGRFTTSNRTMQTQMYYSGGLQLRFMLLEPFYYQISIHSCVLIFSRS